MKSIRIEDSLVVVTGASAGVGRATALEFARRGARLGLIARDNTRLQRVVREVEQLGTTAFAVSADVANYSDLQTAAEKISDRLGPIVIWVNNAMTTIFSPFAHIHPDEFKRVTDVTYLGAVWGTMIALKQMIPREHGKIIQVGSALAYRSIPLQSAYCGAKHAIKGFTDSLRTELLHDGSKIGLTMVHLPALNTPQFEWCRARTPRHPQPVPPIFDPSVAARGIVWAATQDRREVFVGGPTVAAIEANKVVPNLLDHYLARTGYSSQETSEPMRAEREGNLFSPVPGNFADGPFVARAKERSWQLQLSMRRRLVEIAAVVGLGAIWLMQSRPATSKLFA